MPAFAGRARRSAARRTEEVRLRCSLHRAPGSVLGLARLDALNGALFDALVRPIRDTAPGALTGTTPPG